MIDLHLVMAVKKTKKKIVHESLQFYKSFVYALGVFVFVLKDGSNNFLFLSIIFFFIRI